MLVAVSHIFVSVCCSQTKQGVVVFVLVGADSKGGMHSFFLVFFLMIFLFCYQCQIGTTTF